MNNQENENERMKTGTLNVDKFVGHLQVLCTTCFQRLPIVKKKMCGHEANLNVLIMPHRCKKRWKDGLPKGKGFVTIDGDVWSCTECGDRMGTFAKITHTCSSLLEVNDE